MDRRDVIKLGAVAAGVAACGVPKPVATMTGPGGGAEWNAMLDEQLRPLEGPGLLHRLAGAANKPLREETRAALAQKDAAFRRLLSTVLITQSFRELPNETQQSPEVQARMWRHMDQINATVFELGDMLAALDANQRADLRTRLRDKPDLPEALGEALDARAAKAGLSSRRRRQLRRMMAETSFRMRHADPASIIDEYVAKVDKLRETSARDAAAIDLAEKVGERSFWHQQHLAQADDATTPTTPAPSAPPASGSAPGAVAPTPQTPPSMAEVLTKSARSAARRGDCTTVEILRARVKSIDQAYYEANFEFDRTILGCKPGVDTTPPPVAMAASTPAMPAGTHYDNETAKQQPHSGEAGLRTGGYMLGIGILVGLGGAAIIGAGAFAGVFAVTAGVILVSVGLLVLLISAIVYVAND